MADHIWGAFIIIVIIGFSIAGAGTIMKIMEGSKECEVNSDCGEFSYCGSDFKCHEFPSIQKNIVSYDFVKPALVLGLCIVLAALILRKRRQQPVMSFR